MYAISRATVSRPRPGAISTAGAIVRWRYSPVAPTIPKISNGTDSTPPTLSASRFSWTLVGSPAR
jgi:hypothetical protein